MKLRKISFLVLLVATMYACDSQEPHEKGLKDALDGKFYMGAALNNSIVMGEDSATLKLIKTHFNSVVAENVMKSGPIHPREDEYRFEEPDQFVEFGEANDMYIVGHCLVWHSQAPRWFFTDADGNDVSRDVLIERMKNHIYTVAGRYKGRIDAWDVVNEAFNDDGTWRETKFYEIIGEDYIELAFTFASEADPDAELLYNDYSMFHKGKHEAAIRIAKDLKSKGIRIDGIGMQAHYGLDYPTIEQFEEAILAISEAGLDVHITELDIDVLPSPWNQQGAEVSANFEYEQRMNPYAEGLPDSVSVALNDRYMDFFNLFLEHHDKIKRVTMWGVTDNDSWKNNWPIRGRTNYPLLFDRNYQPKPVVHDIINAAEAITE